MNIYDLACFVSFLGGGLIGCYLGLEWGKGKYAPCKECGSHDYPRNTYGQIGCQDRDGCEARVKAKAKKIGYRDA